MRKLRTNHNMNTVYQTTLLDQPATAWRLADEGGNLRKRPCAVWQDRGALTDQLESRRTLFRE
jgi:hypothetical protein